MFPLLESSAIVWYRCMQRPTKESIMQFIIFIGTIILSRLKHGEDEVEPIDDAARGDLDVHSFCNRSCDAQHDLFHALVGKYALSFFHFISE